MALPPPYLTLAEVLPNVDDTDDVVSQAMRVVEMLEERGYTVALRAAVDPERIPQGVVMPDEIIGEGDVISGEEAHRFLPPGSVVAWVGDRNPETRNRMKLYDGTWMPAINATARQQYKVVYLLRPVRREVEVPS